MFSKANGYVVRKLSLLPGRPDLHVSDKSVDMMHRNNLASDS